MADNNHLKKLAQGVEEWNKWRSQNPFLTPDLKGANISELYRANNIVTNHGRPDLRTINFSNAELQEADLSAGAVLRGSNLQTADLRGTILNSADLRNADLRLANVEDAWMLSTKLQNANLRRSQIQKAKLFYRERNGTIQSETGYQPFLSKEIATIDKFNKMIDAIDEIKRHYNNDKLLKFYFRGEACISWDLQPSVMRDPNHQIAEADLLTELMARQPAAFDGLYSYFSNLVISRHYSLPTRLLDITRNPLVALFNACEAHDCDEKRCTKDGKIHVFVVPDDLIKPVSSDAISIISNFTRLSISQQNVLLGIKPEPIDVTNQQNRSLKDFSLLSIESDYRRTMQRFVHFIRQEKSYFKNRIDIRDLFRVLVVEPEQRFDRIRAQSGAFLVSAFHHRFEREIVLDQVQNVPIYDHYVIDIPYKNKNCLNKQLAQLNVSRETLLPSLEEAARAISNEYSARRSIRVRQALNDSMDAIRSPVASNIKPTHVAVYGHLDEVTDWTDAASTIITRLIEIGILKEAYLPISSDEGSQRQILVSDKCEFSSKTDQRRARRLGKGVYLNVNNKPKTLMENCRRVVEQCNFNPGIVTIYWEYHN